MDNPSYVIYKFREVVRFKHVQYVRFIVYCNCNCKTRMDKSLVNFDSEYSYLVNFEESVSEKPSLKLTGRPEAGLVMCMDTYYRN